MRFFLVDRVLEIRPGEYARGVKNVTLSEEYLHDHFPGVPVFPGTLALEALAQLGGFLLECTVNRDEQEPRRAILVQAERAKFHRPIVPGEQVAMSCKILSQREGAGQVEGEALVDGSLVVGAVMTFVLRKVDEEAVHRQRRELYRIWTRGLELDFPLR